MNERILALQRQKAEKVQEMRSIVVLADKEQRTLTEDEGKRFNQIEDEIKPISEAIEREQRLLELESDNLPQGFTQTSSLDNNDDEDFRNLGEFFYTIANNRHDPRLGNYTEQRSTMQMGAGRLGGFMVPERFLPDLKQVQPQEAIVRPRANVIPAGDPPDAKISIPALDQSAAQNIYGGVVVYHQGEQATLTETDAKLKQITLEPKKITGYMVASNELLLNWDAASVFIQTQMRKAVNGQEDYDFFRGNGVNKAMGVVNCDCTIEYSRATANQIAYADVIGMYARARLSDNLVWVASQTTIPQLANVRDSGDNNLWIQSAASGVPNNMFGIPLLWNERSPGLGSEGDLTLAALGNYLIKDGSGPRVDISTDYKFTTDETCFRIVWYVDGNSWLSNAIPLEGSTTDTVSPFVVLK